MYGREGRLSLQAGAGVQIFMTPQEERTAEVISNMLGKKTIVSKSESGKRIRDLNDTANISRKSEERPLVTQDDMLRFPLDKVIIQTKGQSPIKADHIRYFEDPYFIQLMKSQNGFSLPYPENLETPDRPEFENVVMKASANEIPDEAVVSQVDVDALAQVQLLWDDLDNGVSEIHKPS